LPPSAGTGKVVGMSYLYDIAQRHLDKYGVRAAALAKRMGTSPQTLDSWKHREPKRLPEKWLLEALAWETRTPYDVVLTAALRDIDYLPKERGPRGRKSAPTTLAGHIPATPKRKASRARSTSARRASQPEASQKPTDDPPRQARP